MSVAVLIPCHNEATSIAKTIQEVRTYIEDARVIVIDNDSTDNTANIARENGALVYFESQRGKGFAFRRGLNALNNEDSLVLMIDGDATYSLENFNEAKTMINKMGLDMIIGTRVSSNEKDGNRNHHFRRGHVFGNFALSFLFRRLFGLNIPDTLSGWRLFTPNFVSSFQGGNSGFELEAELNAHAKALSVAVGAIEINYYGRLQGSESKLSTYRDGLRILRKNVQLVKNERPLWAFSFLALPWFLTSCLLTTSVLREYFATGLVPRFPSLIAAVGCFIVASQLWVCGIILERVKINRNYLLRLAYRSGLR